MNLSVQERLVLLGIIPSEGNFATLKILRDLQEKLSFTEEEHKSYKFVQDEMRVSWDIKVEQSKDIEIGEKASDIIVEALKKLDDEKKLKFDHFTLFEKFNNKNKGGV